MVFPCLLERGPDGHVAISTLVRKCTSKPIVPVILFLCLFVWLFNLGGSGSKFYFIF